MARTDREASQQRQARKRELRAKLAMLREQLRQVRGAKKHRMRELTRIIRAERLALRERLRARRRQVLEELRETARNERAAAQSDWQRRREEARASVSGEVERARADVAAERARQAEDRRIEKATREKALAHARAERDQSDEHVRSLIPRELQPLFERVKRSIRASSAESRAEAFLRHAEKHPEHTFAVVEPEGEQRIKETIAAIADVTRAAVRGQGVADYAAKRAARIERMRAKAARLEASADSAHVHALALADRIPMGQPVLVGHHSQRRHERDLARIRHSLTKSAQLADHAKALARRADRAVSARAVASDDPEAIEKLRARLGQINTNRERMRVANAAIRAGGDVVGALVALGFREDHARKLLEKDFAGRIGFPDYALRNAAAEAGRVERRIRELEKRAATPAPADVVLGGACISEADNRVRVTFSTVPPAAVRSALKSAGFRWAPSVGVWQRHASPGAWHAAKEVLARHAAIDVAGAP